MSGDSGGGGPAIEIAGLVKVFKRTRAVDGLSLAVPAGDIVGFVGPNGAGKTTSLRVLATLIPATAGRVRVFGRDVRREARAVRRLIGYMPDYFGLYRDMTAAEYLHFFAAAHGVARRQRPRTVEEVLELVGLSARRDSVTTALSRGMQQRLALARALVHAPRLLLLDEPASGLDPRARIELMELFKELKAMGKTIFVSSHILAELKNYVDSVVIIERGRLVYNGPPVGGGQAGFTRLELRLGDRAREAADFLTTLPEAREVELTGKAVTVTVATGDSGDHAFLVRRLAQEGFPLLEVQVKEVGLEDLFLKLTRGGID